MGVFNKIISLLTVAERKRMGILLGMILLMAILDAIGVASILPFMAVLTDPDVVETNIILATIYQTLEFSDIDEFLLFLGVVVLLLLVCSLSFKALTNYLQLHFSFMREYSLGRRLVKGYLDQPYVWFLGRHSADLGKNILSEVGLYVGNGLMPLITLIAQSAIVIAMLVLLIIVDPMLAILVGGLLGTVYGLMFKLSNKFLLDTGKKRLEENKQRFITVNETFSAIKDVKVNSLENVYLHRFEIPAEKFASHSASAQVVAQLPRYALEAIAFGSVLIVILYLMVTNQDFSKVLPIITLYAFAGYRLMPAVNMIYSSFAKLNFATPALDALHADINSLEKRMVCDNQSKDKMMLNSALNLNNIYYKYPESENPALNGVSFTVSSCSTTGLVGATGSGKTTVMDLMLGILKQQKGSFLVDGKVINNEYYCKWQRSIGYIPQNIYLSDDSVAANIAFGVEPSNIDQEAIEQAARIASLHEFVVDELAHGYETIVGERGVRLSGGQRQRIGIARALYCNPTVLFMDEATSALDNITEKVVMEAINSLHHKITIIIIAHRLNTVRHCDNIVLFNKGKVEAQGTYDELINKNEQFRRMASNSDD